jgi:DNA segregation ATPase FtsK/SpoIIIE-like protein
MAIGLDFSMVKKSGLFLVPVTDDHVKYADLFRALIEVAQARPKPSSHEHERKMMFAGEAGMLISFALAGYFLVAMFSYDALDPSWSHSGSNTEIANFGGTAGAWMADLLFYLFGFLAFLLPIMLIYNGMILVKTRELSAEDQYHMLIIRWSGFVLTLVSGCALSSLHFSVEPGTMPLDAGGILGQITGNYFSQGLGFVGATVMHLALFLAGLTLFTGLSWLALIDNTGKYTLLLLDKLLDRYYLMRDKVEGSRNRSEREQVFQVQQKKQENRKPGARASRRKSRSRCSKRTARARARFRRWRCSTSPSPGSPATASRRWKPCRSSSSSSCSISGSRSRSNRCTRGR